MCYVASWLLLSCGSIGEPLPPLLNIPERAEDLNAKQIPDGIVLSWIPPLRTTEAMPIRGTLQFTIHKLTLSRPNEFVTIDRFASESHKVATIEDWKPPVPAGSDRVSIILNLSQPTTGSFAYGIRVKGRTHRSGRFSNLAVIEIVEGPTAPGQPTLTTSKNAVIIQWEDVERASSYQILRGSKSAGKLQEIVTTNSTKFLDREFVWGTRYFYRVRGIRHTSTGSTEGPLSPVSEIFVQDIFPPAPPRQLTAVPLESSIELSWQKNSELDLVGYRVYRRNATIPTSLNSGKSLAIPRFTDRSVERGATYHYTVTAVDQEGNESPASNAVRILMP